MDLGDPQRSQTRQPRDEDHGIVDDAEVTQVDQHTVIVTGLLHASPKRLPKKITGVSRWGHGGLFFSLRPEALMDRPYAYSFPGPFRIYRVNAYNLGSWHILMGFGEDADFNQLLRQLGPRADLPEDGPPWPLPTSGIFGIDYFWKLHKLLREHLENEGYDGFWAGGEVVVWNYDKLNRREADPR